MLVGIKPEKPLMCQVICSQNMANQVLIICVFLALALGISAKICHSPFTQVGNKCYHVSLQKVVKSFLIFNL